MTGGGSTLFATLRRGERALRYRLRRSKRWLLVLAESRPGAARPPAGKRRVLVVRLDAIGDFVLWSGAARALRQGLGHTHHVTMIVNDMWADLASDDAIADDVWAVDRTRLASSLVYRAAWRRKVAAAGFSIAINPCFTREMLLGDSIVRWSRAGRRVGMVADQLLLPDRERRCADAWYTELMPMPGRFLHECDRYAGFLRFLGVHQGGALSPRIEPVPLAEGLTGLLAQPYFAVATGASIGEKRWPAERFAHVIRAVRERTGWTPVLIGDARDAAIANGVAAAVSNAVVNLCGRTSVRDFAAVVQRARLVIGNDSAAIHLAAAAGVHAVCVSGGWHWNRFVPYPESLGEMARRVHVVSMVDEMPCFQCGTACTLPHVAGEALPCVERVTADRTMATVRRVLALAEVSAPSGSGAIA